MKVVITKEYEFDNCAKCPHVRKMPCRHSPIADDYHCGATPENKLISAYVEWEDQLPQKPPEWCPCMKEGEPE